MRYVAARFDADRRERAYRIYISDSMKAIGNLNMRYVDMIDKRAGNNADPEEIKDRIKEKLRKLEEERDTNGYI